MGLQKRAGWQPHPLSLCVTLATYPAMAGQPSHGEPFAHFRGKITASIGEVTISSNFDSGQQV